MAGAARALSRTCELHLIGPLQIQQGARGGGAVRRRSRPSTATGSPRRWPQEIARQGRAPRLFVQVNTGEEPQKAGVAPARGRRLPRRAAGDAWARRSTG